MPERDPSAPARSKALIAAVAAAGTAAAAILGTLLVQRLGDEAADEGVSKADAERFAVDVSYPGNGCSYRGAVGWTDPDTTARYTGTDGVADAVKDTGMMQGFGTVRLHFALPTTAELTAIDVRSVTLRTESRDDPPSWLLRPEGCGGGQYSRHYLALLGDSSSDLYLVEDTVEYEPVPATFEPFSVAPGETVFLDYEITSCKELTHTVYFEVGYKADTGAERTVTVPEDGIVLSAQEAGEEFMATDGEVVPLPDSGSVGFEPSHHCG
ncbi:hypothetical protein FE697_021310 [Mumia zhuanghuii]|uniref:Uncharacterized protein n=2 Tax=Mumia TaxID=1546255 RepID=A0ABW1QIB2_9ACTN|nr:MULTISPECIES: hypothetical protein [Mumia]KAA1418361.1 hypothetical protein FE697_021310 [Mumia zhuanghuii]